ncbi:hypothetical protein DFH11DRAFT_1726275 [Phellopilus nigrolimitatus]|nr:hypothetical protein DFH11DRAFT_1726275 [Phellopilus nigrolimitatus]
MILVLAQCGKPFLLVGMTLTTHMKNLATIGNEHNHVRYANILAAPEPLLELPTLPSPVTGERYDCRIINFDISRKANAFEQLHKAIIQSWLDGVLLNLPYGEFL